RKSTAKAVDKTANTRRCTAAGLCDTNRERSAAIKPLPSRKHEREVMELHVCSSHSVMATTAPCATSNRVREPLLGSFNALRKRHEEANPRTRQVMPSMFLSVVTPVQDGVHVQGA